MSGQERMFNVWTIDWKDRVAVCSNYSYTDPNEALNRAKTTREYHEKKIIHDHIQVFTVKDDVKFGEKLIKSFGMTVYQNRSRLILAEES